MMSELNPLTINDIKQFCEENNLPGGTPVMTNDGRLFTGISVNRGTDNKQVPILELR
ncbi:hypothetical protein [Anaerovibrio slackiae]|uniref:hypothetical protein n=1 Tax=Anaerovibrio slackiae TaxID=2652309 RepID=UPI00386F8CE6|nr:hypothetical protein [Selenomonadaceae bacterium]